MFYPWAFLRAQHGNNSLSKHDLRLELGGSQCSYPSVVNEKLDVRSQGNPDALKINLLLEPTGMAVDLKWVKEADALTD